MNRKNCFYFFLLGMMSFPCHGMNTVVEIAAHVVANGDKIIDTVAAALTIADNIPHPSHDNGCVRGTDSSAMEVSDFHNNRFTHAGLQLLADSHEVNLSNLGINMGGHYLDSIADRLIECNNHQRSVVTSDHDVPLSIDFASHDYDVAARIVESLQEPRVCASEIAVSVEQDAIDPFKNENAFENGHAIEPFNYLSENHLNSASQKGMNADKVLDALSDHNRQEILQKLENIFDYSGNSEIIGVQIASAIDRLKISRQLIDVETKLKLRQFFFDRNGHFHPIDSKARQKEAVNILAPSIKQYFNLYHTNKDFIDFLTQKSREGIAGFTELKDYEIGNDDFMDYLGNGISIVASFLQDEFSHKTPSMKEINDGSFIKHAAKIISLCKAGKIEDARLYVERHNAKTNGAEKDKLTAEEYNSLKIILNDAAQKAHIDSQNVQLRTAAEKTRASKAEDCVSNPSNNEVIVDVANVVPTPPDPEKENKEKSISFEEQLAQDKEYAECSQRLSELKKETRNEQVKDLNNEDLDIKKWEKASKEIAEKYDRIRKCNIDVEKVSQNIKVDRGIIQRIKDHVFSKQHKLDGGMGTFDPDVNIANAWERLIDNKFVQSDLEWLLHEFAESKLEQFFPELPIRKIHDYVDQIHNWASTLSKGI